MSVRTDQVNLNININNNAAQAQLNELRQRSIQLTAEMKLLKKGTQEYIDKAKEMASVRNEMDKLKKQIGITSLSQKELVAEIRKLNALKGSVVPFSQEFKDLQKQIDAANKRLYQVRNGVTGLSEVWHRMSAEIKQFGALAAGYLGFQFITAQFKNIISGAGKLSDKLADLQRVSGLTAAEVEALNGALGRIDTRSSTTALRDIAIIAGKLGVAKEDILGFTKAVDQLVVALGDELGDADQITTQLGKILNVFDGKITGENITKLGNAFVELANSGAATGAFIADFDQRLSGIAKSAGIGLGALSGLGAGLEEMGARVESSATAVQKLIVNINSDLPKAAKIAGASLEEFQQLMRVDPTEGLLRYAEGLVKSKSSFDEVVASMEEAGESGARVIETISKLGSGADQLRGRIDMGKKAIQENNAILDAFALKNETLGAQLDKLGKEFYRLVINSGIVDFFKSIVAGVIDTVKWIGQLPQLVRDYRVTVTVLITALILWNKQMLINNGLWLARKVAMLGVMALEKTQLALQAAARIATLSFAAAQALLTGNIGRATAAWRLLNKAFATSPIGAVVVAVGTLALGLDRLLSRTSALAKAQSDFQKRAAENYSDQVNRVEMLRRVLDSENVSLKTKQKAYQELISLHPEFEKTLRLDRDGHLQGARAIDEYIKSLKKKGETEAAMEMSNDVNKQLLKLEQKKYELEVELSDASTAKMLFNSNAYAQRIAKINRDLANAQKQKEFFDKKVEELYGADANTLNLTQPADTVTGKGDNTVDRTIAARRKFLEGQLKTLKDAYEQLNASDAAGQRKNIAQQKKYQDELDRLDQRTRGGGGSGNSEYARLRKEAEKFFEDIQKLKAQALMASKSDDEKELIALQEKYNEMHARALEFFQKNIIDRKTYNAQEKAIIEAFMLELEALQAKQFGRVSKEEYDRALDDTKDYFDRQRILAGQAYADGEISKTEYDARILSLDIDEKAQLVSVANDYAATVDKAMSDSAKFQMDLEKAKTKNAIDETDRRTEYLRQEAIARRQLAVIAAPDGSRQQLEARKKLAEEQFNQDTELLNKNSELYKLKQAELQDALAKMDEDFKARRLQVFADLANQLMQITADAFTALANIGQRDLAKDKAINDAKKENYKKQLDHKLISQKAYEKKVAAADEELEKKRKAIELKAFKRQQALAITGALINGAMAVTSTLAARPGLADIFSLGVARAIQVGLVVAATAAQVAAIASQQPPSAGRGKLLRGPSHSNPYGGLHAIDPQTGRTELLLEGDEMVIKKSATYSQRQHTITGTPAQIGSKLNAMYGGVSWAEGAVVHSPRFSVPAVSSRMPRIMEQGGIIRPMRTASATPDLMQVAAEQRRTNELLELQAGQQAELVKVTREKNERIHAVVSLRELQRKQDDYNNARRQSGIN